MFPSHASHRHDANVVAKEKPGNKSKKASSVKGTPAWLAPELLDNRDISTKSDVYSFGVILHEMLTRQHPYPGCTVFQVWSVLVGWLIHGDHVIARIDALYCHKICVYLKVL